MNEEDIFIVGYGGWVRLKMHPRGTYYNYKDPFNDATDGVMLQVTGASITRQANLPTVNSYYLPFHDAEGTARSQILLGKGTFSFTGEISFEMTQGVLNTFFNDDFFERDTIFSMSFYDGQNVCAVTNCVWSNFSIQCSPGNLVTVSMSYGSNNSHMEELQVYPLDNDDELIYDEHDLLIPYWTCGHEHFQDFSLSFERPVSPIFLNGDLNVAAYLRPGLVTLNLQTTTIEYIDSWEKEIEIRLGCGEKEEKSIILDKLVLQSCNYDMSSMTDTGAKRYSWSSISLDAKDRVFRIL